MTPDLDSFLKLCKKGNLIPVYREILGDLDTPVSAYFKISEDEKFSFLLESVEGEEKVARFSFLAANPEMVIRSKDTDIEFLTNNQGKVTTKKIPVKDSPLDTIRDIINGYRFVNTPGLPPFCGGIVGYMGYDMVRFFERLPDKPLDDLKLPDMLLVLAKDIIIFDHLNHTIKVVSCVEIPPKATQNQKKALYQTSIKQIDKLVAKIRKPLTMVKDLPTAKGRTKVKSNLTKPAFEKIVRDAKTKIRSGDIIQVVLSQRFEVEYKADPFHIYRMLRAVNPSPYMYYLDFGDLKIAGSSPELLVRCQDGVVDTRPIAGTRPRGKTEQEDAELAEELLADPKEKAEHIMLVDLGRNDLGRVCHQGTVHLSEFMSVEKYSHVMHIVSNVRGTLKSGQDAFDVLQAAFPAGTVSGAPKIRAMEIIDELENKARGPYAGCIGYFSFSGNLDSCITIRTVVAAKGKAYIQAGAGIVADSQPDKEYQETINKARASLSAIEKVYQRIV